MPIAPPTARSRVRYRTGLHRAAVIVVATTALTTTTLGFAAPAGAAPDPGPAPGANPSYTTSTIPVAGTPDRVAVDESTNTAYVTNPKSAPQGTVPPQWHSLGDQPDDQTGHPQRRSRDLPDQHRG